MSCGNEHAGMVSTVYEACLLICRQGGKDVFVENVGQKGNIKIISAFVLNRAEYIFESQLRVWDDIFDKDGMSLMAMSANDSCNRDAVFSAKNVYVTLIVAMK